MIWIEKIKTFFKPKDKQSPFKIEYYPINNRFYPKYYNYYLQTNHCTGLIEILKPFLFEYADYKSNITGAQKLIDIFKEQTLKHGVVLIETK